MRESGDERGEVSLALATPTPTSSIDGEFSKMRGESKLRECQLLFKIGFLERGAQ